LAKESVLVVGLGEVGRPMFELLKDSGEFTVYGTDMKKAKVRQIGQSEENLPAKVDVMHVCIPCDSKERFVDVTAEYVKRFKPKLTIVNSTVPPGTTMSVYKRCNSLVAHSPVRGVHRSLEHMKLEFRRWTKYIGGASAQAGEAARKHFEKMGLKTKVLKSCTETEVAKLFETTYRAWMIACFQEMHRMSRSFGAEFDEVVDFLEDTHRVRLDRPVMFPDEIGGHCLIQNAELLLKSYDSEFLRLLLESNTRRKTERKDKDILADIEKVKKRVEDSQKDM